MTTNERIDNIRKSINKINKEKNEEFSFNYERSMIFQMFGHCDFYEKSIKKMTEENKRLKGQDWAKETLKLNRKTIKQHKQSIEIILSSMEMTLKI